MDIVYILIGFVCGFLCRQVLWLEQKRQASIRYKKEMQDLEVHMNRIKKQLKQAIKEVNK